MLEKLPFKIRLGIGWKFLIAMLSIAIIPLLIAAWLEAQSISQLGAELAAQSGRTINERTRRTLEQTTRHYAGIVNRQARTVELLVRLHAKRAIAAVNLNSPSAAVQLEIPWAASHRKAESESIPKSSPNIISTNTLASEYFRINGNGPFTNLFISAVEQSIFSAGEASLEGLEASAQKLLRMTPFYLDLQRHHRDLFYWQYVALENGVLATFPGHTDYPNDFDARQRQWYKAQKEQRKLLWSAPHTDAATGVAMVNVTMPLVTNSGEFVGVSGMDVHLSGLLSALQLPLETEYNSRVVLSVLVDNELSGETSIAIVAQSEQGETKSNWRDTPDLEPLIFDGDDDLKQIIEDTQARRNGFLRISWQGVDYFCLYEPLNSNNSILMMFVPTGNLLNPAIRSAQHALTSTERYVNTLLPFASLVILAIALLAFISSQRFVKPIKDLVAAIQRVGEGDLETRVEIKTGDELEQLGEAFNALIPQLQDHTKIQQELAVARAVQQRLLPHETPNFAGIEISGHTLYADQTGGDYYDFLDLSQHTRPKLGIVLGDVAGHGVAAAFMMATVRALLHGVSQTLESPSEVLGHININLADDLHAGQFMTLIYLLFDAEKRTVLWADAGHDPAIVYNPTQDAFSELAGDDIPLGVDKDWRYSQNREITLEVGDIVLLGTDGIWETKSPAGDQFGKERLRNLLRREQSQPVETICNAILSAIEEFRDGLAQHDDVSIIVFRPTTQHSIPGD